MRTDAIHIDDGEAITTSGKGRLASPSAQPAAQGAEILEFQSRRRLVGLEDAMEPDEGFEPLGSIAVRLVAAWKLPRISCRSGWEEAPTGAEGLPVREG